MLNGQTINGIEKFQDAFILYSNCKQTEWVIVAQSCLTLCNPMDYSPPGSSVHGILQARLLEWVAISFLKETWELLTSLVKSCWLQDHQENQTESNWLTSTMEGLIPAAADLAALGLSAFSCNCLQLKSGHTRGHAPFTKNNLHPMIGQWGRIKAWLAHPQLKTI